jgi:hypothetical protein
MTKNTNTLVAFRIIILLSILVKTTTVMLLVGGLHSQVPEVPPISWVASSFVVAIFSILALKPDYHTTAQTKA